MRALHSVGFLIGFIALLQPARGDGPDPQVPELAIIDRFVGTWDYEVDFKTAEWTEKPGNAKGVDTYKWALGGRFLQGRGVPEAGKPNSMPNALWMMTFDKSKNAYRMWFFESSGNTSEWLADWDATKEKLTWTSELAPNVKATVVWKFSTKDSYEYTLIAKNAQGKVYLDVTGKLKRRTPAEKPAPGAEGTKPASDKR